MRRRPATGGRPDEGMAASIPSDEMASPKDARGAPTNWAAWCHRCGQHRVGEPPPDPEVCGIPEPDTPGRSRRRPDYQTSAGVPIPKDPHAGKRATYGGGGRWFPQRLDQPFDVPGLKSRGRVVTPRGLRKISMRTAQRKIGFAMSNVVTRLEAMMKVPAARRPGPKEPLPPKAEKLIRDFYRHERFWDMLEDGLPVDVAGPEAFGSGSTSTAYNIRNQIEAAGNPHTLFIERALALYEDDKFPWGNRIQAGPWAKAFFTRLAEAVGGLDALNDLCRSEHQRNVTLMQAAAVGDMATLQVILFGSHAGLITGRPSEMYERFLEVKKSRGLRGATGDRS